MSLMCIIRFYPLLVLSNLILAIILKMKVLMLERHYYRTVINIFIFLERKRCEKEFLELMKKNSSQF